MHSSRRGFCTERFYILEENQKRELEAAGDDANKDFGQMSDTPAEESGQDIQSAKERGTVAKLLIIGAVICALAGLFAWNSSKRAGNYSDLQNRAESASTGSTAAVTTAEEKSGAGVTEKAAAAETAATAATAASIAEEVPIDFKNIREDCPDVYAWICILTHRSITLSVSRQREWIKTSISTTVRTGQRSLRDRFIHRTTTRKISVIPTLFYTDMICLTALCFRTFISTKIRNSSIRTGK